MDPVQYIKDTGTQQYPVVDMSPNYLDPAQMDGVIEPLVIRHTLSNTRAEGPHEAHTVRASLQPESGPNLLGKGTEITRFLQFEPRDRTEPFFDSQNIQFQNKYMIMPGQGYANPPPESVSPFNDSMLYNINTTDIDFSSFELTGTFKTLGSFIDDPRIGILGKSSTVGFIYNEGTFVSSTDIKFSGNRRSNGADSIAFGGLLK